MNNIISRQFCVLCENSLLKEFTNFDLPFYTINHEGVINSNWNIKYGYCEDCFSVQLMNLLDPEILYDKNYIQPNFLLYSWVQHNISFINFIIGCIDINEPLIEIGSSSFVIGKHLIDYYNDYTVFDYKLDQAVRRNYVKYIEGNCESYDFPINSNIIMSHVFEHLYEPKKFISNCKKSGVKNIIIAIPDMSKLEEMHVFSLHTFLYNDKDIEYIFGKNKYKLVKKYFFNSKDESFPVLFFHFELTENIVIIDYRNINKHRHLYMQNLLKPFNVPSNTYITSAGMLSSCIYALIENKGNIVGVIDKNKTLHGKQFANSNLIINSYEHLKDLKDANIIVCHYRKNDIIKCIREYNTNINIIEL